MTVAAKEQRAAGALRFAGGDTELDAGRLRLALEDEHQLVPRPQPAHELQPPHAGHASEIGPGDARPCLGEGDELGDAGDDGIAREVPLDVRQVARDPHGHADRGAVPLLGAELEVARHRRQGIGPRRARKAPWLAAATLGLLLGCGGPRGGSGGGTGGGGEAGGQGAEAPHAHVPKGDTSPPLRPPSELGPGFVMEQQVTMEHPEGEHTFRAVLEKTGDKLTLLGLAPHGGRAFVLVQQGREISFESFMPRELPFPPEYMMHDVHRAWFLGEQEQDLLAQKGERVSSEREDGEVVLRRFERVDGRTDRAIEIRYEGGLDPEAPSRAAPPDVTVLDNGWYGYRATLRTLSWRPLEG